MRQRLRTRGGDRGAVAVTVSVLLAGGVLLGFMALVVDVGRLYVEREELQSGADAAAMAIAHACGDNTAECATTGTIIDLAQDYADANAKDGVSGLEQVCGRLPGKLDPCDPPAGNVTDCIGPVPPGSVPYVEVRVRTETSGGESLLPPSFANNLLGNGSYQGTEVGACARATWEPGIGPVALAISTCEFNRLTNNGADFGPSPPYAVPPPVPHPDEVVIRASGTGTAGACPAEATDWEESPPVSWLATNGPADCEVTIPTDNVFRQGREVSDPLLGECARMLRRSRTDQIPIYVVVYDGRKDGSPTTLHGISVVPFVVTGFRWGTSGERTWNRTPNRYPCSVSSRCVSGFFIDRPIPLADYDPDRISLIRLVG